MPLLRNLFLASLASQAASTHHSTTPNPLGTAIVPFITPIPALTEHAQAQLFPDTLFARQEDDSDSCPASHRGCGEFGRPGVCCRDDTYCTVAEDNKIACCRSAASCTGSLGEVPTAGGGGGGGQNNAVTTVDNDFYPWPYIPASFSNRGQCQGYVTSCQDEYRRCTSSLVGGGGEGGGGVTISGPGVNVGGGGGASAGLGQASAADVCNSLSREACRTLGPSSCNSLPAGTAAEETAVPTGVAIIGEDEGAAGRNRGGWAAGAGVAAGLLGVLMA